MRSITGWALVAMLTGIFALGGCEEEGPAEQAGEDLDEAAQEMGNQAEDAADAMENQAEEAQDEFE